MNKTTICCTTSAPMFMAGHNKDNPELRAASIKGIMRFIWRAIQQADDIGKLRNVEGRIFGNAFGGKDTKASEMRIRVEEDNLAKKHEQMVPHRTLPEYGGRSFTSNAISAGEDFSVVITSFADEKLHIDFIRLFATTCLLCGFGRRSRKGFGTIKIKSIDGIGSHVDYGFTGAVDNLNALSKFSAVYSFISDTEIAVKNQKPAAEYPYIESIKVAGTNGFSDSMDIIKQIGMSAHLFSRKMFLGSANPRFASSVLLSTIPWNNTQYRCIITQLHCTKKSFRPEERSNFYVELDGRV